MVAHVRTGSQKTDGCATRGTHACVFTAARDFKMGRAAGVFTTEAWRRQEGRADERRSGLRTKQGCAKAPTLLVRAAGWRLA